MPVSDKLKPYLDDLDARIDETVEQRVTDQWTAFWEDRWPHSVFRPDDRPANPPRIEWPEIHINDALEDDDLMVLSELGKASGQLDGTAGKLCVRCNYGTGILPSVLGCELFVMPRETDTLPTVRPLGSAEAVEQRMQAGPPDVYAGLGERVFRCAERFQEIFEAYPRIARWVDLYHPDLQGPVDVTEMVWGSSFFLALYDDPDLIHRVLDWVSDAYAAFMREWYAKVGAADGMSSHWGIIHPGRIFLRNDSLMNLSPEMYVEFVQPRDQRLLDEFGGGAMHACGRGDHYVCALSEVDGLVGVNFSQPELNDMETICRHTVDKGLRLLGLKEDRVGDLLASGRPMRGRAHVA